MRPILFALGPFEFVVSPVFAGLSAILAAAYCWRYRREADLSDDDFWAFMLALSLGTFAGGILLYFFFFGGGPADNWDYLLRRGMPRGGAFFGNAWGALITVLLFARAKKLSAPKLADLVFASAPLALALMRLGCFLQGCCHGKPSGLPWAVTFTSVRSSVRRTLLGTPLHPTQIYESLAALAIFLAAYYYARPKVKSGAWRPGAVFLLSAVSYAAARFVIEGLRGRDAGLWTVGALTTNQLFALVSAAAAWGVWIRWRKNA